MIEGIIQGALAIILAASFAEFEPVTDQAWLLALPLFFVLSHLWDRWRFQTKRTRRGRRLIITLAVHGGLMTGLAMSGWSRSLIDAATPLAGLVRFSLSLVPWLIVYASSLPMRRTALLAQGQETWELGPWIGFHLRGLLLPFYAVGLTSLLHLGLSFDPAVDLWLALRPATAFFAFSSVTLLILLFAPWAVRWAFPSRSLEDGRLRDSLTSLALGEGFRFGDVRVIATPTPIVNALVVGPRRSVPYIFFTEGLLARLDEEAVLGVFAHEMAHGLRRHALYYLMAAGSLLATATVLTASLEGSASSWVAFVLSIAVALLFLRFVFSPLSKLFETEADLEAARALKSPTPIARALGVLAVHYPSRLEHGGLLHPSLRDRMALLANPELAEAARLKTRERSGRLRMIIVASFVLSLFALGTRLPMEWSRAGLIEDIDRASREDSEDAALAALSALTEDLRGGRITDPEARMRMRMWQIIATHRQDRGDYAGAEVILQEARSARDEIQEVSQVYSLAIILAQQAAAQGHWLDFRTELGRAERSFPQVVAAYGLDSGGLAQEARDLKFLRLGVCCLARWGIFPQSKTPRPMNLGDAPEYRALEALWGPDLAQAAPLNEAELTPLLEQWRLDFLRRLSLARRRASQVRKNP